MSHATEKSNKMKCVCHTKVVAGKSFRERLSIVGFVSGISRYK